MPRLMTPNEAAEAERGARKCWKPECQHDATVEDWAGWKWCDEHKDLYSGEHGYKPLPANPDMV